MPDIDVSFYPKANPNALLGTAGGFVDLANAAQQNKLLGIQTQQSHQDLVKQQVGSLVDVFSALSTDPNVNYDTFVQRASTLLKQGVIDPNTYHAELANLPKQGTPQDYQKIANGYLARALDAGQRFGVETGMAPGSAADLVTYTGPTGATVTDMRANAVKAVGGDPNPFDNAAAPSPSPAAGAPSRIAPLVAAPKAGTGIAAPTPQQIDQFKASSQQQQDDLTADAAYASNIVPLKKTLELLPATTVGLGSDIPNDVVRVFSTFGIPIGTDQAKNASEVEKYLTQLVRSSGAAANSDNQLTAAFAANPNMTTDKAAATDVLKTMLSLTRMQHAKVAAAQAEGVAPEGYSKWASQWGSGQDPRAFGVDLMTPEAKATLMTEIKKDLAADPKTAAYAAGERFINSLQLADQQNIFGGIGAGGAGGQ